MRRRCDVLVPDTGDVGRRVLGPFATSLKRRKDVFCTRALSFHGQARLNS